MYGNKRTLGIVATLLVAAILGNPNAAADPGFPGRSLGSEAKALVAEVQDEVVGGVTTCTTFGITEPYVIKDRVTGPNYQITILYGLTTKSVRVAWNNQVTSTHDGTNIYLTYGSTTINKASKTGVNGGCGVYMGNPTGSTFKVRADFAGMDVEVTHKSSEGYSLDIGVMIGSKFMITLSGSKVPVNFGVSGSFKTTSEHTVKYYGKLKIFEQDYSNSATTEFHPVKF